MGYLFKFVNLPPKAMEDFLFHVEMHCFVSAPLYEKKGILYYNEECNIFFLN